MKLIVDFASGLALALGSQLARGTTALVLVGGPQLSFEPAALHVSVGDSVTFTNLGGFHNVVADDGSFRCAHGCDGDGHGGSGAPSSEVWSTTIKFPVAGEFGYFCELHGSPGQGMFGSIDVTAETSATLDKAPLLDFSSGSILLGAIALFARLGMRRIVKTSDSTDP